MTRADTSTGSPLVPWHSGWRGLAPLFRLSLRQHLRGRRLLVLSLLLSLPSALAALVFMTSQVRPPAESMEFGLLLNLVPHALAPLAALLYAASIVQDDVEEQTLTYLLLRPLPKWAIYLVKWLATWVMTAAITTVFTAVSFVVINATAIEPWQEGLAARIWRTAAVLVLAQVGYCGLFGLVGLVARRSFILGVAYIVLFEGLLASLDTVARRMTVMYYARVLFLRWLDPASGDEWSIDLATAPQAGTCVLVLVSAGILLAMVAAALFAGREFRMKTPESV